VEVKPPSHEAQLQLDLALRKISDERDRLAEHCGLLDLESKFLAPRRMRSAASGIRQLAERTRNPIAVDHEQYAHSRRALVKNVRYRAAVRQHAGEAMCDRSIF